MTERLEGDYVKGFSLDILDRSHADQQREEIPKQLQTPTPADAFSVFLLFNLEAAYDFGHVILALGPMDGALETYSFYRQGTAIKAPALMACLEHPLTFAQIEASSGWIVHGQPGNYWNEHVNAALALWCMKKSFDQIRAFAEEKRANPGVYDLFSYNCLTFVIEALAQGGVSLEVGSGKRLRTFIPRGAFRRVSQVAGAHKLGAWKYWFPLAQPPENGLRTISDTPGKDRPLK